MHDYLVKGQLRCLVCPLHMHMILMCAVNGCWIYTTSLWSDGPEALLKHKAQNRPRESSKHRLSMIKPVCPCYTSILSSCRSFKTKYSQQDNHVLRQTKQPQVLSASKAFDADCNI